MGEFMVFCSYVIHSADEASIIIIIKIMMLFFFYMFLCFFVKAICFQVPAFLFVYIGVLKWDLFFSQDWVTQFVL